MSYTVRCIGEHKSRIIEGEIRAKELAAYLEKLNCQKSVWLSEDATVITAKVTYDPTTNQLIGLVLPLDGATGCPIAFTYIAENAERIKEHLMQPKSTVLYIVMAQPLSEEVPPFILQMFGSNNRFDTANVLKRWKYTRAELEK